MRVSAIFRRTFAIGGSFFCPPSELAEIDVIQASLVQVRRLPFSVARRHDVVTTGDGACLAYRPGAGEVQYFAGA